MTYDPRVRPIAHFAPRRNWMNDPNGLLFHDGEYHLFFQYNAEGADPGKASWGHAVSADLVSWEELPVALAASDDRYVLSGSAVVDERNVSGLGGPGTPPMVAMYTSFDPETRIQTQSLASSVDRGRTWTQYRGNPVIDIGSTEFRDPKVMPHDDGWTMALVLAEERRVRFYGSDDLIRWSPLSEVGPFGSVEGVWECPDVVRVPIEGTTAAAAVLLLSVQSGAPAGGSGMQYIVGAFDGVRFVPSGEAHWFDLGSDCYAAVSFTGAPDPEPVVIGWMSNWRYAAQVPAHDFRGSMTLPRRLSLRERDGELRLVQRPIHSGHPVTQVLTNHVVEGRMDLPDLPLAAHILLDFAFGSAHRVGIDVRVGDGERTRIVVDREGGQITLDRTRSGGGEMPEGFAAVHAARLPVHAADSMRLAIYVDVASVEVFAADGEVVLTDQVFPSPESKGLALFAEGGSAVVRSLLTSPL